MSVSYAPDSDSEMPVLELHLIGMRVEEAMHKVEKQIDGALIHGLREFSIVHGKGEGKLRTAVHAYLRTLCHRARISGSRPPRRADSARPS